MTVAPGDFPGFCVGDDVSETFHWRDSVTGATINITGHTFTAMIRTNPDAPTGWAFTVTVSGAAGNVTLSMLAAVTATIPPGRLYWGIRDTTDSTGLGAEVIAGRVVVTPAVVR